MKSRYESNLRSSIFDFRFYILLAALSVPSLGQNVTMAESKDARAKYEVILERNISSRQRGPIRSTQRGERPTAVVTPNPESYFLLKGGVLEGDEFVAFLEDTRGDGVLRLREGDSVRDISKKHIDATENTNTPQ